jgi:hypothetical protein
MRGLPICATSCGRILTVWFGSPTKGADSSDSFQFSMPCVDEFHASDLVEAYGKMISASERVADLEMKLKATTELLNRYYTGSIEFEAV